MNYCQYCYYSIFYLLLNSPSLHTVLGHVYNKTQIDLQIRQECKVQTSSENKQLYQDETDCK